MHVQVIAASLLLALSASGVHAGRPEHVRFSNLDGVACTVSWTTRESETGQVIFAKTIEDFESRTGSFRIAEDDRGGSYEGRQHFVTLGPARVPDGEDGGEGSLEPDTEYILAIVSGGEIHRDGAHPYRLRSAALLTPRMVTRELSGRVLTAAGAAPSEPVLVILKLRSQAGAADSQSLCTLSQADGSWNVPLSGLREESRACYLEARTDDDCVIEVFPSFEGHAPWRAKLLGGPEIFRVSDVVVGENR